MVYTTDLKSVARKGLWDRYPLLVPSNAGLAERRGTNLVSWITWIQILQPAPSFAVNDKALDKMVVRRTVYVINIVAHLNNVVSRLLQIQQKWEDAPSSLRNITSLVCRNTDRFSAHGVTEHYFKLTALYAAGSNR